MIILMPNSVVRRAQALAEDTFLEGIKADCGGDTELAIELYKKAINLDPRVVGAMVNLGTIYFKNKELDEAESHYRDAIDADLEYPLAHYNLASLLEDRGNSQGALGHYLIALRLSPKYADAHFNIALLYQELREWDNAIEHWYKYIELDPLSSSATIARRELGKLETRRKRTTLVMAPRSVSA